MNRRQFFKLCAGGAATTAMAGLGLMPNLAFAAPREFKLIRAKETRNNCCYCSVGCGLLMYSRGDMSKNVEHSLFHIEGDADHPVSRGALCPKGAGLIDFVNSENRLKYPEVREPGSSEWTRISWNDAFKRIARLMKDDRDQNMITKNADGTTVNRWMTTGLLAASAQSNENGLLTQKFARGLGLVAVDTQARI